MAVMQSITNDNEKPAAPLCVTPPANIAVRLPGDDNSNGIIGGRPVVFSRLNLKKRSKTTKRRVRFLRQARGRNSSRLDSAEELKRDLRKHGLMNGRLKIWKIYPRAGKSRHDEGLSTRSDFGEQSPDCRKRRTA
jgi:hypothetical protein